MKSPLSKADVYKQLLSALNCADSVLLFTHVSPDGDTLGSALALKTRLERLGKKAAVLVNPPYPSALRILPGIDEVIIPGDPIPQADLYVAVDVASHQRLGDAFIPVWDAAPKTWVIDHHDSHGEKNEHLLLDAMSPAAGLLVYRLFQLMNMPISKEEAICLYTAVSTDTGNFVYDATNAECFEMMVQVLRESDFTFGETARILHREKEPAFIRLLSKTLPSLRLVENDRMAGLVVTQEMLLECHATQADCDGLIDYAIDIHGVDVAYSLREMEDGRIKCSMRSKAPYCVNAIAASFGGGGHARAAGCTLKGVLQNAVQLIENALVKEIHTNGR